MSKLLEFYKPEYFTNANIWTQGDASTRRTVIVPLNGGEFLGFGMLRPWDEVLFVARGRVDEHQEDFIARMEQAGARVEFRTQRPVQGVALRGKTQIVTYSSKESEGPPSAPNLTGSVSLKTGGEVVLTDQVQLWPTGSTEREVVVVPVPNSTDFIGFGLCETDTFNTVYEVPFVVRLPSNYRDFTLRMDREQATVVQYEVPPQNSLKSYMTTNFGSTYVVVADALNRLAFNDQIYPRAA
ncbi:MAG TPA: hypothetical protein VF815_38385 [Myxococcaceae bacterium]|jgi:hypothetical protein